MFRKTEGLAWLVLLLSFFLCITLATGIPLGIRWFVLNGMRPLKIMLEPRAGAVTYQPPGSDSLIVVEHAIEVEPRGQVELGTDGDALLLYYDPDEDQAAVGTVQLYNSTTLVVGSARTPRFDASQKPHHIELQALRALNMRPSISGNGRTVELLAQTPQGSIHLEEGYFHLIVEQDQTELTVLSGRATVTDPATEESLMLVPLQRTQITTEALGEIYVGERDILRSRNGGFESPLGEYWTVYQDAPTKEEDQGTIRQSQLDEETQLVYFSRAGQNWAEIGIRQEINQDIREAASLRIRARVRIDTQTLPVCGSLGTECPIMIHVEFVDAESGGVREWLQGFYFAEGDNDPLCQACTWKALHEKIPQNVWYDYDSDDLLPLLQEQGLTPAAIHAVEVYASGWTYGSAIDKIAILVGE